MRRLLPLLLAFSLTSLAGANERLPVTQVRFSADGAQVMTVVSGERDGSGFGTAQVTVLDTRSGRIRYAATRTDDATPRRVLNALLNTAATRSMVAPFTARPLSVPRYQRVYPVPYPRWPDGVRAGQVEVTPVRLWTRTVPVRLEVLRLAARCPYPEMLPPGEVPAGVRLTVNGQEVWRDRTLPAARACATRYTLERVDVQGNRALFTLRALTPGFEGPDALLVFVAALLR
ncbi:DUF2259 domain-containing protein [Deinococcus actinosclerus]|uniref:DUF2259 domain-containing protein n=1 Tax=Deinococcus actinosclerus TaxID=1768108 RepID=A0ABN4K7V9_9DEIO|nr:DUF2259 domain-containing protein [Deinococcus actinosclerus]ALW89022.1 hypothetical protein AUC44_09080 [Deinococcus actinosclerus]